MITQLSSNEIAPKETSQTREVNGLGMFLFQMHSLHYRVLLFAQEEMLLQFYDHLQRIPDAIVFDPWAW